MDNFLLMKKTSELEELSSKLGFENTFFLGTDLVLIDTMDKKKLLNEIKIAKNKSLFTVYQPKNEELLRFALEKTSVDMVFGLESINHKDSLHYLRSGLDQIYCRIAQDKNKIIGFSFSELLNAKNQPGIMARMKANIKICQKYRLNVIFGNFSLSKEEMRSAKDLETFFRFLGGNMKKSELTI